jgi:hypothetical protein
MSISFVSNQDQAVHKLLYSMYAYHYCFVQATSYGARVNTTIVYLPLCVFNMIRTVRGQMIDHNIWVIGILAEVCFGTVRVGISAYSD